MAQGSSSVNGPHQGAWIDTPSGEHWFMHFQDKDAYGRVVHLQPMEWTADGWPVIGIDKDGDGVGEPVIEYRKPQLKSSGVFQPAESDSFADIELGLQWQWHAVPSPYWYYLDADARETDTNCIGALRLYSVNQSENWRNLGDSPNLLMQKTPADEFTVTSKLRFIPNPQLKEKGENCGFVLMGLDYATVRLTDTNEGVVLQYVECKDALKGTIEQIIHSIPMKSASLPVPYSNKYISATVPPVAPLAYKSTDVYIRMEVKPRARKGSVPDRTARFFYSLDGKKWHELTEKTFIGRPGKWIGAKFGFYCNRSASKNDSGWVQIDWVNVTR
jgi:beta-xylosidase